MIISGIKLAFGFFIAKILWALLVIGAIVGLVVAVFVVVAVGDWWGRRKRAAKNRRDGK